MHGHVVVRFQHHGGVKITFHSISLYLWGCQHDTTKIPLIYRVCKEDLEQDQRMP